jgi:hypothetical protein
MFSLARYRDPQWRAVEPHPKKSGGSRRGYRAYAPGFYPKRLLRRRDSHLRMGCCGVNGALWDHPRTDSSDISTHIRAAAGARSARRALMLHMGKDGALASALNVRSHRTNARSACARAGHRGAMCGPDHFRWSRMAQNACDVQGSTNGAGAQGCASAALRWSGLSAIRYPFLSYQ